MQKPFLSAVNLPFKAGCCALALLFSLLPGVASARTWTAAKSGQKLEGEYESVSAGVVSIRNSAGKLFKVKLSQLSSADQKYVTSLLAGAPLPAPKREPVTRAASPVVSSLQPLASPFSVTSSPMTGSGNTRLVKLKVTNKGGRTAKSMVLQVQYLRDDGSLTDTVPHSQVGFFGTDDNLLRPGQSYDHEVNAFFMDADTTKVEGIPHRIEFEDGSSWPALPAKPAQLGTQPVSGMVIGLIGEGAGREPVAACYNYSDKAVKEVRYKVLYQDSAGKTLGTTSYGYGSSDGAIMTKGAGVTVVGGDAPPEGAAKVQLEASYVEYTDGSKWKAGE